MPLKHRAIVSVIALTLLIFSLSVPALAQTVSGNLQGTATDGNGDPLPGVTVTIRNLDTGQERVVITNESGLYLAPFLPIGKYRATATLEGLGSQVREPLDVTLNNTTVWNVSITPQMSETVTVTAEQSRINTVNAEIKSSLTAQEIIDKPTPPSNGVSQMLSLAETFAGFQENPSGGQNNPTTSSGSSVNFGAGTRGTTFQINGVNNDDSSENQNRQGVPLSTIKEFQVLTNNFSAEFGRGYGAVVLVQTKSGTNDIKGDLYGLHTDNKWNEKSYFARTQPLPVNHRTQYGFTAGFPIMQDRLFGFVNYENNERAGEGTYTRDIFLESERNAPRLTRGNDTPANRAFIEMVLRRFPQVAPNDARSNRTYLTTQQFEQPDVDYSARLDGDPHASHHITARYQVSEQLRNAEDIIIGEQVKQENDQSNLGVTWTHIFTPMIVGEFRYGLGVRNTNANIKDGNTTPIIRFVGTPVAGSIIGNSGNFPINRDQVDNQFVYNVNALLFTNHSLKAGTDIRRQKLDDNIENFHRGFWNFRAVCGGTTYSSAYTAFLDGCVNQYQQGHGPTFLENEIDENNFYVEDNWQALPGLTLNLGARYEMVEAPKETENRINYGFGAQTYTDPRFGFAYTPDFKEGFLANLTGGPGNFSVRGGYGIYHGRVFQSLFSTQGQSLRGNPPTSLSQNFTNPFTNQTNVSDPTNGFVFVPGPITARHSIAIADPDLQMPSTKQWNVTLERNIGWNSTVRVTYANKESDDLLRFSPDNLPVSPLLRPVTVINHPNNAPGAGLPDLRGVTIDRLAADFACAGTGMPTAPVNQACPNVVPLANNEISQRFPRSNERRPDPRYAGNILIGNTAESTYESVQLEWIKRFSHNLSFQTTYTYSEAFDNLSEATPSGAGDVNATGVNREYAWGPSRFDTPHRFTFYGSYRIPFFRNRKDLLGLVLGGWQIAPVLRYASGTPFTVSDSIGSDIDFDGFTENRPVLVDRSVEGRTIDNPNNSRSRLPGSAFRRATPADSIDDLVGRNSFRSDNTETIDLGLYKNFDVLGDVFTLRFEAYNLLNEVMFGIPVTDINSANFGVINGTSATYAPRTYQVGLRYQY